MSDISDDRAFGLLVEELGGLADPERSRRRALGGTALLTLGLALLLCGFAVSLWLGVVGLLALVGSAFLIAPHLSLVGAGLRPRLKRWYPTGGYIPKKFR